MFKIPMLKKITPITFWALVGVFFIIVSEFFIPQVRGLFRGSFLFLLPIVIFAFLGAALMFFTIKGTIIGRLKKFLLLTGASAAGFFVSIFLHNAFYGLAVVTSQIVPLNYLMEVLHVLFFLVALFVCPLGFLIGAIGSLVLFAKKEE